MTFRLLQIIYPFSSSWTVGIINPKAEGADAFIASLPEYETLNMVTLLGALAGFKDNSTFHKLKCPVLFVIGENDRFFKPRGEAIEMIKELPLSDIEIIKNGSHFAWFEHGRKIAAIIGAYQERWILGRIK